MQPAKRRTMHAPMILALNPGSTSTKIALFTGTKLQWAKHTHHPLEQLRACSTIAAQADMRALAIAAALKKNRCAPREIEAVAARGGLLHPCASGVYHINQPMLDDLEQCRFGAHASNLGAILARRIAAPVGIPAFVVDPPVVDELCPEARLTGFPGITRRAVWHALSQKMAGRVIADRLDSTYEKLNLVIAHLGGGISIAAHLRGRAIQVNNAIEGDGPFAVERSGGAPVMDIARMTRKTTLDDMRSRVAGSGGLVAHLGTNDFRVAEEMAAGGNPQAATVVTAMAYQIAREIGACAAVLCGTVDAVVLTGALTRSKNFVRRIKRKVNYIAPVHVLPRDLEMQALAAGALRVLTGTERPGVYRSQ